MSKAQKDRIAKKIEEALFIYRRGIKKSRVPAEVWKAEGYLKGIRLVLGSFGFEYEEDNGGNVRIVKA